MTAPDAAWWAEAQPRRPTRTGVRRSAVYVKTKDGTRIAVDLFLPGDLQAGEQLPTLMTQTPYLRAVEFRANAFRKVASKMAFLGTEQFAEQCVGFGYAFVLMDLRGSGASFGQKGDDVFRDSAADGSDVIDWIIGQPWSNGRVGATGVSGHGLCAMWQTTARNPALKAIAPRFTSFDNYMSTHPGGTVATRFMRDIGALVQAMDSNQLWKMPDSRVAKAAMRIMVKGIKPVDEDTDRRLLAQAIVDHRANASAAEQMTSATFRDDAMAGSDNASIDSGSVFSVAEEVRSAGVPIYACGGWLDAAFARELIELHNTVSTHIPGSRLTIGPWGHGGWFFSSPAVDKKTPTAFDHAAELTRFFDVHLRDTPAGNDEPIHYFTMGEERWKSTATWPVPSAPTAFYLGAGGRLTTDAPHDEGADRYRVDYTHGTGVNSRFGKHLTSELFPVSYPDRTARDKQLLVYDSEPLAADMEVTGHPLVELFVASSTTDGLFIVYLEDVDGAGTARTVGDGWLQASYRKLSDGAPPYWVPGPYRTYTRRDAEPLVPGEVANLTFDLYPTSWLFRRGHRVRIAVAGADKDNLQAIGIAESPTITMHHGGATPSRIVLPVVAR